jgi:TonB-linked SusC/RagA family outer membrane protein
MKLTFLYNPAFDMRRVKYKFLIVMKLTAILLLIGTLHLSAASYSQSITISKRNTTLTSLFKDVKKQTGYLFFYSGKVNISNQPVDVELKNVPLEDALTAVLKDFPLKFNIVDKTIVITNKAPEKGTVVIANNFIEVTGKVIDSKTQLGIPGVNVYIKGNKNTRTTTNDKGEFKINSNPNDVLVFVYVGFQEKEVKVGEEKYLTISLEDQINQMEDVVITGYQTIKKESYTGNAIVIKGEDLKRTNPQNLLKAIQSFDPSFRIVTNNLAGSDPNALYKINVRGTTAMPGIPTSKDDVLDRNNISASFNLPAFIMDGFEVSLQKVVDLDINRIESVTLLKDAAASAVYGSRAANGVMVITTKAPVAGKLQLSYNYEMNFTAPDLSDYHVLNAEQKIQYEQLAGLYDGRLASNGNTPRDELDAQLFARLKNVASGVNTYWLSQPLRNTYGQKHSINAQGGDQTFRYGLDARYQTQPGVMKGTTRDRYSGGVNFIYSPNPRLIIRNDLSVTQSKGESSPYGSFSTYALMNPYYPKTDSAGRIVQELGRWSVNTFQQAEKQFRTENVFNPLFESSLSNFSKEVYTEILNSFSADYKLSPSLRLRALLSYTKTDTKADQFKSPSSNEFYTYETSKLNNRGSYDFNSRANDRVDGNATLNYFKQVEAHAFNVVLGVNVLSNNENFKAFSAQGFSNDKFSNVGFARIYKENSRPEGNVLIKRTASAFFSGNYAYQNKYLFDGSFRMDGSSTFGSNRRFAPFGSVGLGWNAQNEDFLKDSEIISLLRLKGSIGMLGSVGFDPYISRSIYTYQNNNWYSTGVGATAQGYGNDNLEWQKTHTLDLALNLGFLKDRFILTPAYYYKLTKGIITDINLSPSTGFTSYKENLGDMENNGFEVYLQANVYRAKDLNVNITGNVAHNTNTLVKISNSLKAYNSKIDDLQNDLNNNLYSMPLVRFNEGQSMNTIYAVKSLGIDPENGREIYVKNDGSLTYEYDVKDTRAVGNTTPTMDGSIGGNVMYKGFQLSFSFYYKFGGQLYNQTLIDRIENANPRQNVDSRALTQRWIKPGDNALYKNIQDLSLTRASSRFVQKDNLIDLQSVYLSYDFSRALIRKAGFQNLRAAIAMNDIYRISSVEIERGIDYPFARSFTFSLQTSF